MKQEKEERRGRPRGYDADRALKKARDAFWRTGYAGTSVDALSDATDMNKPSLYGAFGDKRSLYLKTLERYIDDGRQGMQEALRLDVSLRDALLAVYDAALAMYFPRNRTARGCFLIGTAATESVVDAEVRATLGRGLREFDALFEARLREAKRVGEIDDAADPRTLAGIASAILHTLALRSRAGDSEKSLRATAVAGVDLICGPEKKR